LYLVRQIVKAHNGRIQLESHPGSGAMFTVELPLSG
jgi:signal transduction histidine kinase